MLSSAKSVLDVLDFCCRRSILLEHPFQQDFSIPSAPFSIHFQQTSLFADFFAAFYCQQPLTASEQISAESSKIQHHLTNPCALKSLIKQSRTYAMTLNGRNQYAAMSQISLFSIESYQNIPLSIYS
jgi:hypothetical protein